MNKFVKENHQEEYERFYKFNQQFHLVEEMNEEDLAKWFYYDAKISDWCFDPFSKPKEIKYKIKENRSVFDVSELFNKTITYNYEYTEEDLNFDPVD